MKFVVFGPNFDTTDRLFDDIKNLDNVEYLYHPIRNIILRKIYSFFNLYMKFSFLDKLGIFFSYKKEINEKTVFLFLSSSIIESEFTVKYINVIKKKYTDTYYIAYLTDIHAARKMNIAYLKKIYDYLFIFDDDESIKLGIDYYPLPYSNIYPKGEYSNVEKSDLYFVGQAKSRFNQLIQIFEYCEEKGIKTNFNIIGIPKNEQLYIGKINYIDFISYEETLKIAINSKCGLELLVEGVNSFSNRVQEALVKNKKIITNNISLKNQKFYDDRYICYFEDINEVDPKFIKECRHDDLEYDNSFSPIYFLLYLENLLLEDKVV